MNLYLTTETENKLRSIISNIKSFYIIDVQTFINSFQLDLTKEYNIYFLNSELLENIKQISKLKKYQGIIYINQNLNECIIKNLQNKVKSIKDINKIVLLDNGSIPKHKDIYDLFEQIYFYERFCKNKIIDYSTLQKENESLKKKALK